MRRLTKFWRAPAGDKVLLCQCLGLVLFVRLSLWAVGFHRLQRWLAALSGAVWPSLPTKNATRVVWAVKAVSRYVPGATCLTQALVAKAFLERIGHSVTLRIGVARNSGGRFEAHAWLEEQGLILIGRLKDLRRFTSLPPLEERNQ